MKKIIAVLTFSLIAFAFSYAQEQQIAGEKITNAVRTDLILAESVNSQNIDVETDNGVVTLSGSVPHILAKDMAEKRAEAVKGLAAVINTIEVKKSDRSDTEIQSDVSNAFINDPVTESWELETMVNDGTVTLTGTVDSWAEKRFAGRLAKGVKGVRDIQNRIDVDYQEERSDFEIKKDIQARQRSLSRTGQPRPGRALSKTARSGHGPGAGSRHKPGSP